MSGPDQLYYKDNCVGVGVDKIKSVEEFQACLEQSKIKTPLIKYIGIESFNKQLHLNSFATMDMILPEKGSIGLKRDLHNPTFELDSGYTFLLVLFDKDFFIFISNPLIVPRSVVTVFSNSSFITVGLKVRPP